MGNPLVRRSPPRAAPNGALPSTLQRLCDRLLGGARSVSAASLPVACRPAGRAGRPAFPLMLAAASAACLGGYPGIFRIAYFLAAGRARWDKEGPKANSHVVDCLAPGDEDTLRHLGHFIESGSTTVRGDTSVVARGVWKTTSSRRNRAMYLARSDEWGARNPQRIAFLACSLRMFARLLTIILSLGGHSTSQRRRDSTNACDRGHEGMSTPARPSLLITAGGLDRSVIAITRSLMRHARP